MMDKCRFPELPERYDTALRMVVEFIMSRYKPVGIIAAGSIIRGNPDKTSDFDMHVVHHESYRQRVQKFFNGIPAEIFLNPPRRVEQYLEEELESGCPSTATMLTQGFVVYNADPAVDELLEKARKALETPPRYSEESLNMLKYMAATLFEDAMDIIDSEPAAGLRILGTAINEMVQYYFKRSGMFIPRLKERLQVLKSIDPYLAEKVETFYLAPEVEKRISAASVIAERTIGVQGFFEWESKKEEIPDKK